MSDRDPREAIVKPDPFGDQLEACPFIGCNATPKLVTEQASSGPLAGRPTVLKRIPQHPTGGNEWFGPCPASLLEWPLGGEAWRNLSAEGKAFARMYDQRHGRVPAEPRTDPNPQHSKTPRPDERARGSFWNTPAGRDRGPGRNFNQNVIKPNEGDE